MRQTLLGTLVLIGLLATACASPGTARTVTVRDRLDGPSLSPDWNVSFQNPGSTAVNAYDWEHDVSSGTLVVTAIEPCTLGGGWSYVSLSRSLGGPVTDFSLSLDVGWKSVGLSDATNLVFTVYAEDGGVLGKVLYHDCWTGTTGEWVAIPSYPIDGFWPATREQGYADYRSGYGTLPACGSGTWTIARSDGVMSLKIGEQEVLSYAATQRAARVEMSFGYLYDPDATFGDLRVDRLDGTVTIVPGAVARGSDASAVHPPRSSIAPTGDAPVRVAGVVQVRELVMGRQPAPQHRTRLAGQ